MVTTQWWWRGVFLLVLAGALAAFWSGGVVAAEEPDSRPSFGLRPVTYNPENPQGQSYFVLDAWPGETIETEVMVANTGDVAGVAQLYAVDATTGGTSGVVYQQKHVTAEHVGQWVALGEPEMHLEPGEERQVRFTVTIPDDARPGHHVGGIVVVPESAAAPTPVAGDEENGASVALLLETRMAVAVQVTVPGAKVAGLEITGLEPGGAGGYQTINLGLENTGNVMLKPRGELVIRDSGGEVVQDLAFQLDTFLPETAIAYAVYIEGEALGVGTYDASVTLVYGDGQEATYRQTFSIAEEDLEAVFEGREPLAAPSTGSADLNLPGGTTPMSILALAGFAAAVIGTLGVAGRRRFMKGGGKLPGHAPERTMTQQVPRLHGRWRGQRSGRG